ncbi:RICIN domain-containing protein [Lentzea sp. NEAU-D7]|uniref:RICIN domain-containing protein n=1 Tax=Lentzea sp. NEAU-D7 TaxID=2994667 RepID=UPI00224A513D|nr:RICIN domain-containing protein [Lentzea sp. NEAU-D7]MCX2947860.1 RICIN domain-containing protein [Lentzea sp. NEAU-D7]
MRTPLLVAALAAAAIVPVWTVAAQADVVPGTAYQVTNVGSGKCVESLGTANGAQLRQQGCSGQTWTFTPTSDGYFTVGQGQVWDVSNVSVADNAAVHMWQSFNANNQQWRPEQVGTDTYRFVNRHSAKCLDVPGASTADVQLVQYTCNGTNAQLFRLAGGTQQPGQPDFGPNVLVFDPSMPAATIQARLDDIFRQQEEGQYDARRYAIMFKPGNYNVDVNIGFFTQVLGLGMLPDGVTINGQVHVEADWFQGNATHNFWRGAENLAIRPPSGTNTWAVSQASAMRRTKTYGNMQLDDNGWSSGGFLADSVVTGQVRSGSQQQWLSRNTEWGSWTGENWNMVFVGARNAPQTSFPEPPYTNVAQTPVVREKPFLNVDGGGNYNVFVPALRSNTSGTTWASGTQQGTNIPLSQFYIAKPGTSAATINAQLAAGKHLLLTPGVHQVSEPIRVTRPDTVVLGLGLATVMPTNGNMALDVADVDGVKIAGILIDAAPTNSPLLMQVGAPGSNANHSANPTSLHDVYARIGGSAVGRATTSLVVNSHNVIGDHLWLWRGDHSIGVGWDLNTADTGLIVNGNNVTMYGLFVEHYQKYQTIWNGQGGRTYFYQNEMPYEVPNQAAWMNGSTRGYAAYKVSNNVTTHEAWGLGSYAFMNANPSVVADRAFEVPNTPGVKFHSMVTVSLGGKGTIQRIINNSGGTATAGSTEAYLANYP